MREDLHRILHSFEVLDAHRIAPKLWVGGRPSPAACQGFDVIVLCAVELQHLELPCRVIHAPLDDAAPTETEVVTAFRAARAVNALRRDGKRVLVTCAMGINRSAFVAALALVLDGLPADHAIEVIRKNRRPRSGGVPLSNKHFVAVLKNARGVRLC